MNETETGREFELKCNGGGGCVIVEKVSGCIVIRDSKNPTQPGLIFSKKEYADFRSRVRDDTRLSAVLGFAGSLLNVLVLGLRRLVG
jgi:Domain of unknown function (DUF397)